MQPVLVGDTFSAKSTPFYFRLHDFPISLSGRIPLYHQDLITDINFNSILRMGYKMYLKWMKRNSDIPRRFLLCNAMLTIKKNLQYKSDSVPMLLVVIPKINVSISSNSRVFRLKENFLHIKSIPINHHSRNSWISINKILERGFNCHLFYTCTLVCRLKHL